MNQRKLRIMRSLPILFSILLCVNSQLTFDFVNINCASGVRLSIADTCQFQLTVGIAGLNQSDLYVEILTSNVNTSYAQLCKPSVNIGQNVVAQTNYLFNSDFLRYTQYDRIGIDFGTVRNTGATTSYINVTLQFVIIDQNQANDTEFWLTVGAQYYNQSEIWIGTASYNLDITEEPGQTEFSFTEINGSLTSEIGKYGQFDYVLQADTLRYFSLNIMVTTNSPLISICSIVLQSADTCYSCLQSLRSTILDNNYSKQNVSLLIGGLANTGKDNTTSSTQLTFRVYYKLSEYASIGENYTIDLEALVVNKRVGTFSFLCDHTFKAVAYTPTAPNVNTNAAVNGSLDKTTIGIFEPFKLTLDLTIPNDLAFNFTIEITNQVTSNKLWRVCSSSIVNVGDSLPCLDCVRDGSAYSIYSNNSLATNDHDSLTYKNIYIFSNSLRNLQEYPDANKLRLETNFQLLQHSLNVNNANVAISLNVKIDNQIAMTRNFQFSVSSAFNTATAHPSITLNQSSQSFMQNAPSFVNFEINVPGNTTFASFNVVIEMPRVNGKPLISICTLKWISGGTNLFCSQDQLPKIILETSANSSKTDRAKIEFGTVSNMQPNAEVFKYSMIVQLEAEALDEQNITMNVLQNSIVTSKILRILKTPWNYAAQSTLASSLTTDSSHNPDKVTTAYFRLYIPANTYGYYTVETNLINNLTNGSVSLCSLRIVEIGVNMPCFKNQVVNLSQTYDGLYNKMLIKADLGAICNTKSDADNFGEQYLHDDDSILIELLTVVSPHAVGSYGLLVNVYNTNNRDLLTSQDSLWNIVSSNDIAKLPDMRVSRMTLDPNDANETTYYNKAYKGQTVIYRYSLTLNQTTPFTFKLQINIALRPDQIEIQKMFISKIGSNLPCTRPKALQAKYENSISSVIAELDLGVLCYYPINASDSNENRLNIDAFIRIPLNANVSINGSFDIQTVASYNGIANVSNLAMEIADPSTYSNLVTSKDIMLCADNGVTPINALIREIISLPVKITIPLYTSTRVMLVIKAHDLSSIQDFFGSFVSVELLSVGCNIAGFLNEYDSGNIKFWFLNSTNGFYYDMALIDFGIITNTQYSLKMDDYDPDEDNTIKMNFQLMITDNPITNHLQNLNVTIWAYINSDVENPLEINFPLTIQRSGQEAPLINITSSIVNDTSKIYATGSGFDINFSLQHDDNSTAEARDLIVRYFLPPYVKFDRVLTKTQNIRSANFNNNMLVFQLSSTLYFGEKASGTFRVAIDPNSSYVNLIRNFENEPKLITIPYMSLCQKLYRSTPVPDQVNKLYTSGYKTISYKPEKALQNISAYANLISSLELCQITEGSTHKRAALVFTSGFTFGYRSVHWYQSGSNYIEINFGNLTLIETITINQMTSGLSLTPFSKFKISISTDGVSFASMPEVAFPDGVDSYKYKLPSNIENFRVLRIHITDVQTSAELAEKKSGLVITSIIGFTCTDDPAPIDTCVHTEDTTLSRSILNIDSTQNIAIVCDETYERSASYCYRMANNTLNSIEALPHNLSSVLFYIKDISKGTESIYGFGYDKKTYLKSDDLGHIWTAISPRTYHTARGGLINCQDTMYVCLTPEPAVDSGLSFNQIGQWSTNSIGLYYDSNMCYNWYDSNTLIENVA